MICVNIDIHVDRGLAHSLHNEINVNPLSSAAQTSGVNDDCYVLYYIQQLNRLI